MMGNDHGIVFYVPLQKFDQFMTKHVYIAWFLL